MVVGCMSMISENCPDRAVAVRGEPEERQLVLKMKDFEIHVRMWSENYGREVLGQIQPYGSTIVNSARLHLLQRGERINSTQVNDLGQFRFSYVPDGSLSLQVELPHLIAIGALD
jgi:hypothetical protein